MKKHLFLSSFLGIAVALLCIPACSDQEAPHNPAPALHIGTATVSGRTTATISGTIAKPEGTEIAECGFIYSTVSTLPEAESTVIPLDPAKNNGTCTVQLTGLQPNTHYYYCLYASSGYTTLRSDIAEFTTHADGVPTFAAVTYSGISPTGAILKGEMTDDGGYDILTLGFCYKKVEEGDNKAPDIEDHTVNVSTVSQTFTATLEGLEPEQTYIVCAYGVNQEGVGYSEPTTFSTQASTIPMAETLVAEDITETGARLMGRVASTGGSTLLAKGFYYDTDADPVSNGTRCSDATTEGDGIAYELTDLAIATTYYYCAYAENEKGLSTGEVLSFTTAGERSIPVVQTAEASQITETSARLSGSISSDGHSSIISKGFYWSTQSDLVQHGTQVVSASEGDAFTYDLAGLTAGTTYYACAYAENEEGTGYGEVITFSTQAATTAPTVGVTTVSGITENSADVSAEITADGGTDIIEKGFCYSSSNAEPTLNDTQVASNAAGNSITATLEGLTGSTTYYVRAYATNARGTSYGAVQQFTTDLSLSVPALGNTSVSGITSTTATASATITADGGAAVTEKGFYYGTNNPPTEADMKVVSNAAGNAITADLSGLAPDTRYYIRAFATNSAGTALGAIQVFITADDRTTPSVGSVTTSNITGTTVDLIAIIIDNGGGDITEKGFCYTTDANVLPTTADNKAVATSTGDEISLTLTGLAESTTYYIRAYASNGSKTGYSGVVTVTTGAGNQPGIDDNPSPGRD